jgi:nitrite reductase/ring-hydroxylating ferredoxin subunit
MFQAVARIDDLPEGKGKVVDVGQRKVLVLNMEGQFFALDSYCAHRGAPLVKGEVVEGQLLCPWHGSTFDVSTGTCRTMPDEKVPTYPIQVREGQVWVDLETGEGNAKNG